ncbi:Kef-type K+ ransport system, predicted NAD-binding component [Desulfosporosinus meridiei DSM 13257]|uniref:Kef-type K+ ransport system, predicted NAD-binding component n=1 Tax=Desulfosporosinus meridiei (strain ATCC BAA-275 / DSM 13257 / KCTC 12902 / NCIMB 13706 / S10) TaxID=768704 RepID=J7IY16_DESMD|nr:potassium channel family protein [Desulfosporosinus meridiei]AFQ45029.1 Kef-type K+ ransport system, predicted NAD-binding component [Desulfosporosinus meridiei DSM 13257]
MHFLLRLSMKLVKMKNTALAIGFIAFVLSASTFAYMIEAETFETWFNSLYFVLTTMATVGYGDYSPSTFPGKVLTIFIYVFGIGLLSLVIGKIIDAVADFNRRREAGRLRYQGKNHVIIVNWSKKAQYAIEEILSTDPNIEVVIIDEIDKHPYDKPKIHFISGDPSSIDILEQADIKNARSAIVFADARIDEPALVDGKSLLLASTIESIAPKVHTTVEIMMEKHIQNFKHVKVNDFVLSHDAVSRLAVRSALNEGSLDIFTQLLSRQKGADVYHVTIRPEWKTYEDAFLALIKQGATLVSNKSDMTINTKLNQPIPTDAKLFAICDGEVYKKINNVV